MEIVVGLSTALLFFRKNEPPGCVELLKERRNPSNAYY